MNEPNNAPQTNADEVQQSNDAAPPDSQRRNATWWRDKFARAERTLREAGDALGMPRASDYSDLPEALRARLVQADSALAEARARCDELRAANQSLAERDILWRIASGSESPDELRARLREAREIVGCDERASFLARLREVVEEREALRKFYDARMNAAIDDDAVNHDSDCCCLTCSAVMEPLLRAIEEREPRALPKPERVEQGQWWQWEGGPTNPVPFMLSNVGRGLARGFDVDGAMLSGEVRSMLTDPRWRYLGNGARPEVQKRGDAESEEAMGVKKSDGATTIVEATSGVVQVSTSEIERVANEAREAGRAEMRDGLVRLFQRMGEAEWCVAIEAIRSYSLGDAPPEPKSTAAHSDERWHPGAVWEHRAYVVRRLELRQVDEVRNVAFLNVAGTWSAMQSIPRAEMTEANGRRYIGRPASEARPEDSDLIAEHQIAAAERDEQNAIDRELNEHRAEVERLRMVLLDIGRALEHRSPECIVDTAARVVRERDAAYRRGQEEMRKLAAASVIAPSPDTHVTRGELAARISALPIANAPTASASGEPGEVDPGRGGTETAGAGDSVARVPDLAKAWKDQAGSRRKLAQNAGEAYERAYHDGQADALAYCADTLRDWRAREGCDANLQVALREANDRISAKMRSYSREIAEWRAATGCETPEFARDRMARIAAGARRRVDAPKNVAVAASERVPQMGDVLVYKALDGERPAIVLAYEPAQGPCGALHVRDMRTLEIVELSAYRDSLVWRFRT